MAAPETSGPASTADLEAEAHLRHGRTGGFEERRRGLASGGSSCSTFGCLSSSKSTLFGERSDNSLKPVLWSRSAERFLSHPDAPPRRVAQVARPVLPALQSPTDVRPEPELRSARHDSKTGTAASGDQVKTPLSARISGMEASRTQRSSLGSRSLVAGASHVLRPPSPLTVTEAMYTRSAVGGRGFVSRSDLDGAVSARDAEEKGFASYRAECSRDAQALGRRQAVQWQAAYDREQKICELRWLAQDPRISEAFDRRVPEGGDVRLLSTPIGEDDRGSMVAPSDERRSQVRSLRDSTLKPRRPLASRLRSLRRNARVRKKMTQNMKAEREGSASDSKSEDEDEGASDVPRLSMGPPASSNEEDKPAIRRSNFFRAKARTTAMIEEEREESRLAPSVGSVNLGNFADDDAATLQQAFAKCDLDRSDSLDHFQLLECLVDLGLRPKTEAERTSVRQLIWDWDQLTFHFQVFSTQLVPTVRAKLTELRHPGLVALFKEVDIHGNRMLSVEDTLNALRRQGTFVSEQVCHQARCCYAYQTGGRDELSRPQRPTLDADKFVAFVRILQEYTDREDVAKFELVVKQYGLGNEDEEHWHYDLVELYEMFHEYDPCSGKYGSRSGSLDEQQVITVLRESGYMPKTRSRQATAGSMIRTGLRADGTMGFQGFLNIMHTLREWDRERLRKAIDTNLPDRSGVISWADLPGLLPDCGVAPKTPDERAVVHALMEDCTHSGSGLLAREEVVILCQRIAARMRLMQHERERQYVLSAGWTKQHFSEFRGAFQIFDEDMSEVLERDELMKAVELLKGHYWQSDQNINLMFVALGIDPNKDIKVNFLTFLRMLKMLDESEALRQQGAEIGFGRDRSDKLFSCFQALEPESAAAGNRTVKRDTLYQKLSGGILQFISKVQVAEVLRVLSEEPAQVEFPAFLRIMKLLEGQAEGNFEDMVDCILTYQGGAMLADLDLGGLLDSNVGDKHRTSKIE